MKTRFILLLCGVLLLALFGHGLRSRADDALRLDIARTNSNVILTWTNTAAALESSLVLPGAWSEVTGAVSPRVISPTNLTSFFRLRAVITPTSAGYNAPSFTTSIGDPFGCGCTSPENPNSLAAGGGAQDNGMGSVLLHTGELTQDAVDLEIPGRGFNWRFERRYRSGMSYDGPMGQGWDFNYNRRLIVETNGNVLCVNGLGRVDRYTLNTNGTFTSPAGFYTQLGRELDGSFRERDRHGGTNVYSATNTLGIAKLTSISDRNANQMTFQYSTNGQLTNVVDTLERSITYGYDPLGRLRLVTDFAGRALSFAYDSNGNLISATSPVVTNTPNGNNFPSGKTMLYTYSSGFSDPRFNHNLLSITAPNEVAVSGPARLVAQYDTNPLSTNADRVLSLRLGGTNTSGIAAGGTISYTYTSFGAVGSTDYATPVFQNVVSNRNGDVTQYRFNQLGNTVRSIQFTRGIRAGDPAGYTNIFAFNGDGEKIAQTNAELDSAQYTFDSANPDRLQQGNLLQITSLPGLRGGDQTEIVVVNTYEPNFNFVATTTDGRGNPTMFSYDERGNCTNVIQRLFSIVDDYEYNSFGQMTAHILPENDTGWRRRDELQYYSSGSQKGYLQSQTVDAGSLNLTTSYEYDSAGNLTRTIDPLVKDTLYSVNALNQVVRESSRQVSTASGLVRHTRDTFYDANDNVVRTDVENRDDTGAVVSSNPVFTTTCTFNILDRRIGTSQEVSASSNIVITFAYDSNDNPVLTRFGEAVAGRQTNNVVQMIYDERGLVFREILAPNDPGHSTTQLDYDGDRSLVRRSQGTESTPRITTFAYDGYNRLNTQTDPMGNVATYHYDANGNMVTHRRDGELTDLPGGTNNVRLAETIYNYDAMDRLWLTDQGFFDPAADTNIAVVYFLSQTVYTGTSQVSQTIDANGHVTTTTFDTANRPSVVTDAKANTVAYTYDANGRVITVTESEKSDLGSPDQTFVTQKTYDSLDRLIQTVDTAGNTNHYAYDSRNNLLTHTDGRGNFTRDSYDGVNRRTTTTRFLTADGLGSGTPVGTIVTRQNWDDSFRLIGQMDGNSNTTAFAYDSLDRTIQTTFADGTTNRATFDVHGNKTSASDAVGNVVNSTFDLLNRETARTVTRGAGVAGTTFENYQYDGLSRPIRLENDDSVVTRSYDSLSRILNETQQVLPGGTPQTIGRIYDAVGNRIFCSYPGGRFVNTGYDERNRPQTISDGYGTIAGYYYFGRGRVERRDYSNGTRADYGYDNYRHMTNSFHSVIAGGSPIDSRAYAWDAAHNKTACADLLAPTLDSRSFTYDSANRLVRSVTAVAGPTISYTLDAAGNRLSVTGGTQAGSYSMNAAAPPADFQMNQYTATPFDTRTNDANGNLASAGPLKFVFDYRNQLVAALRFDGISAYTNVLSAKYDCFGRRLEKAGAGTTNRYYYAGWQEIEEQDGSNATVATCVWGGRLDDLLETERSGQSYFFHNDILGNVRKVTGSAGNVLEQYRYGDYGKPSFFDGPGAPRAGTQIGNATLFTGRRYDPETGLYYFRSRYLDPAAGRFISRDRIGIWGDRYNYGNGFAYAANNPWSCLDPLGMAAGDPIPGVDVSLDQIPGGIAPQEPKEQAANNYNSAKSNTAGVAAAGDPIPGVDVSLDQIPGGIAPQEPREQAANNYNSAKSNTAGVAAAGDPIPGVDVSLDQIPGGITVQANRSSKGPYTGATSFNIGDPIPGVDVSLDQIPGGVVASLLPGKGRPSRNDDRGGTAGVVVTNPHTGGSSIAFGGTLAGVVVTNPHTGGSSIAFGGTSLGVVVTNPHTGGSSIVSQEEPVTQAANNYNSAKSNTADQ